MTLAEKMKNRMKYRMEHIEEILSLLYPELSRPLKERYVLDLGCGTGVLSVPTAKYVNYVKAIDLNPDYLEQAAKHAKERGVNNIEFELKSIFNFNEQEKFDIVFSSDVLEHVEEQERLLAVIVNALKPGGVFYPSTNNKLWPLEGHYGLPFLTYLPRKWADRYVAAMGKGQRFCVYPLSYSALKKLLDSFPIQYQFKPPEKPNPFMYKLGKARVKFSPFFWNFANAFQGIGKKE